MTLMAQAYQREGSTDLMMEMLSLAVGAANKAPTQSLRYARALVADEQPRAAENVLIDALRLAPTNEALLTALGSIYLQLNNWAQTQDVIDRLNELGTETSVASAVALSAQVLAAQNRSEELRSLLSDVAEDPDSKKGAEIAITRSLLADEGPQAALEHIEGLLVETPDDAEYQFVRAGVLIAMERAEEAEAVYRSLAERFPQSDRIWLTLFRMKQLFGDEAGASAVLEEALVQVPRNASLLMARALELQTAGDVEGAIDIYEMLYEANSNSVVVANNLSSLLADYRTDDESLQRAYVVARRLRGAEQPALQDTYGWIAHRMGNIEEALPYLESAAAGLPNDPVVQYHYGASLASNGQRDAALEQLELALGMVDQANPPRHLDDLLAQIEAVKNPAPATESDTGATTGSDNN